jgi:hypothetical protein
MSPKKPDWFELTEGENASSGIRKVNKKLSIGALVAAGAIIFGGTLFATGQDESPAAADTSTNATSQPSASQSLPAPSVTNIPQRGEGEHEGRENHDGNWLDFNDRDHEDRGHEDGDHEDGDHEERDND